MEEGLKCCGQGELTVASVMGVSAGSAATYCGWRGSVLPVTGSGVEDEAFASSAILNKVISCDESFKVLLLKILGRSSHGATTFCLATVNS